VTCKCCNIEFNGANQKRFCSIKCREAERYKRRKDSLLVKKKNYYLKNKAKINAKKTIYKANKNNSDLLFKLKNNLRSRFNKAFSKNYKNGSAIKELGCSINELKLYLESKFKEGMSWGNYGKFKKDSSTWNIDHIRPLSHFNLNDPEEVKKACHFTNLQPLWAKENLIKSNNYFSLDTTND